MQTPAKRRRARFAGFALIALTLGTILMSAPTASAQWRRGGFYGGRPYYGGFNSRTTVYNRGYGGFGGFNSFGNNVYNRGYGGIGYGGLGYGGLGYGGGLYSGGFYGNGVAPIYSPIGVNNFGYGSGFGGVGGFY